jgi:hypothetical protein
MRGEVVALRQCHGADPLNKDCPRAVQPILCVTNPTCSLSLHRSIIAGRVILRKPFTIFVDRFHAFATHLTRVHFRLRIEVQSFCVSLLK